MAALCTQNWLGCASTCKHVPTETGCRGQRGGCGGVLLERPGSVKQIRSKVTEKSLINKMM